MAPPLLMMAPLPVVPVPETTMVSSAIAVGIERGAAGDDNVAAARAERRAAAQLQHAVIGNYHFVGKGICTAQLKCVPACLHQSAGA